MRRLYLRIYLAVLASLLVFALAAGFLWRQLDEGGPAGHAFAMVGTLAQNALPPVAASRAEHQSGLERLAANLRADVSLYAADRTSLAVVGAPLPAPERPGWLRRWDGPPAWAVVLPDGRWLIARLPREHRHPALGLFAALTLIALAVGVGAYPVVRRLTRRLERLQQGVEALGAGALSARVAVDGGDEVARLAASFNRAAARIEDLVGAHKALLANASHELRTPLARIRMGIELIEKGADPRRKLELARDIAELDALIDEVLLASRLDATRETGAQEDVDLLALAAEECARYEAVELDGQPLTLRGDPRLLRRMLRNLLENAKRHGAPPIEVKISGTDTSAQVLVCDRGTGIPEAERERVFEPFYRRSGASESAGAGLGLALVRQIARRHGGEAVCDGNCFRVTVPM